jgi:hypothetical protein
MNELTVLFGFSAVTEPEAVSRLTETESCKSEREEDQALGSFSCRLCTAIVQLSYVYRDMTVCQIRESALGSKHLQSVKFQNSKLYHGRPQAAPRVELPR